MSGVGRSRGGARVSRRGETPESVPIPPVTPPRVLSSAAEKVARRRRCSPNCLARTDRCSVSGFDEGVGPVGRRVAKGRTRARLHARRPVVDSRRAHGGAGCARGIRRVRAVQRADGRANGGGDLTPFFRRSAWRTGLSWLENGPSGGGRGRTNALAAAGGLYAETVSRCKPPGIASRLHRGGAG